MSIGFFFFDSCYFVVMCVVCICVFSLSLDLLAWDYLFLVFFPGEINCFRLKFSLCTYYGAGFVNRYCLNLVLSYNVLFSLCSVIGSFVGCSI